MSSHDALASTHNIPSEATITAVSYLSVFDSKGNKVCFGDIFASSKTIVVFIRHFFCGMCQAYVSQLASVPGQSLLDAGVNIALVGCGEWQLIEGYKKNTGFSGEIYANPSRDIYRKLGMKTETLAGTPKDEKKRSYVPGILGNIIKSIWRGLLNPLHIGKQGNLGQIGGDFIFGPGNTCQFAYLMQHTQDHTEVVDLMQAAGVKYS